MDKKKTSLNKMILLPAAAIVAVIFIILQFTIPQIKQSLTIRQDIKVEKESLEKLVAKSTTLEKINEQDLKEKFQSVQDALPSEKNIPGLLYAISRLGDETGVSLGDIELAPGLISTPSAIKGGPKTATPSGVKVEKGPPLPTVITEAPVQVGSLNFNVGVTGEYPAIRKFLGKIREISPLLSISKISLNPEGGVTRPVFNIAFNYQLISSDYTKVDDPVSELNNKDRDTLEEISLYPDLSKMPAIATFSTGRLNPFE